MNSVGKASTPNIGLNLKSQLVKPAGMDFEKGEQENFVGILANAEQNKCGISVILSENLIEDKNLNASKSLGT